MLLSIIGLILFCLLVAAYTFSLVVCSELAIKPLGDIKRTLLVNMSKRKLMKETNVDGNIEEDNSNMKKFEHIIFTFRLKYVFLGIFLGVIFIAMCIYSHVDFSAILVAVLATIILLYLLSRLVVLNDEVKEASYEPIKKYLKLDDKFMDIIIKDINKDKNKEEVSEENEEQEEITEEKDDEVSNEKSDEQDENINEENNNEE